MTADINANNVKRDRSDNASSEQVAAHMRRPQEVYYPRADREVTAAAERRVGAAALGDSGGAGEWKTQTDEYTSSAFSWRLRGRSLETPQLQCEGDLVC